MKSVAVIVFFSFVTFVAGVESVSFTKVLSSLKSTRDEQSDLLALAVYLLSCPDAVAHQTNCLSEHSNYTPTPVGDAAICEMKRIELGCLDSTFAATTCLGEQDAIDATGRLRSTTESECSALGNSATSVVTGFFTVFIITCVNLLK